MARAVKSVTNGCTCQHCKPPSFNLLRAAVYHPPIRFHRASAESAKAENFRLGDLLSLPVDRDKDPRRADDSRRRTTFGMRIRGGWLLCSVPPACPHPAFLSRTRLYIDPSYSKSKFAVRMNLTTGDANFGSTTASSSRYVTL